MFDVALLLANQPVPAGNRVVIVTNALDPGVLAAAACAGSGLSVAPLSAPALDRLLAAGIPPVLAQGVVDLRPTASPGDYLAALGAVLVYPPGIAQKAAHELVSAAEGGWMEPGDAAALLGHYGIAVADAEPRGNHGAAEDRSPWETGRGVLRVHSDPLAGPVISFGLAGLFSELFSDVATGVTPLTDRDATALLASLRAYPLLTGASGGDQADLPAIEDTLLRLSALVEDWPTVAEVVIDALLIGRPGEGVTAVAPAVRIANPTYR